MPSRFQTMKCAASDDCTTSTAWMRLPYSWPMRWNTRSAPVRSTRGSDAGIFRIENNLATRSATGRSTEVYQTTLPSLVAASIKRLGDLGCRRRRRADGRSKDGRRRQRRRSLQHVSPGESRPHGRVSLLDGLCSVRDCFAVSSQLCPRSFARQPVSTRQRSGGNCSQTEAPCAKLSAADVITRNCVPSAASTM